MLREKVKVWDRFHGTEQKNGGKDEKLKKWGAKIQMVENPKIEEMTSLKVPRKSNSVGAKGQICKVSTTTTTQNETKACWDSWGLNKKPFKLKF